MATHYLRLRNFLKPHAIRHGAAKAKNRWAEDVFNDLTEKGQVLVIVPLSEDGHESPVLGLCGKRFFGEVCRDDDRPDCLFLFKLLGTDEKPPTGEPSRHRVDVRLLLESDMGSPILNSVDTLLSSIPNKHSEVGPPSSPSQAVFVEPSQKLRAVVRGLDLESIRHLCPEASRSIDEVDRGRWRSKLNALCRRFDRKMTKRDISILKGYKRSNIDIELDRIGKAFDVTFLNSLGDAKRQRSLLLELLDLPVGAAVTRRTLWLAWLSEQEPGTLKAELHGQAVDGRLAPADSESDSHLDSFLLKTLGEVGRRHQDESLRTLADEATDSDTPWSVVAAWASKLVVGETGPRHPDSVVDIPEDNGGLKTVIESVEGEPVRGANQAISDTLNESETDTHLAVKIDPPKRPVTLKSERDKLASWVIAQRVSVTELVEGITNPVQNASQLLDALRDSALDTSALKRLQDALAGLQEATAHALQILPTLEKIDPLITEAAELVATLKRALGRDLLPFLDQEVSLDVLRDVAGSEPLISVIRALPDWAAPPPSEGLPKDSTDRLLIKCLREDKFRQDMERLGESLTHSGENLGMLLGSLPSPPSGLEPFDYLIEWANQAAKALREIQEIKGPAENWTMETLTRWRQPRLAGGIAHRLGNLEGRVSAEVIGKLTESVVELAEDDERRQAIVDAAEQTVAGFERMMGNATTVTIEQWDLAMENATTSLQDAACTSMDLAINHNFVDSAGSRVNVTYVPYTDRPYGFVKVPLALESSTPVDSDLALEWTVKTDQRSAWPSDWDAPEPSSLSVRSDEWKEVDNRHFQRAFLATIPIRDPSSSDVRDARFRVAVTVSSDSGESLLHNNTKDLVWEQLQRFEDMPELELDWPDGVKPDYVKDHPVGGQSQAGHLLQRLRDGGSFAMVAPRRFGKSTLIDYIANEAQKDEKLLVLPPFVCTSYSGGKVRPTVWKNMHDRLIEKIGVGLTTTEPGDVPSTDDLKAARAGAWDRNYQGIVLLIDEAQLFFAGRYGYNVGDKLKDGLEREWTRLPEEKLASIQVGLVGLPNLLKRMGTNVNSALQAVESHALRNEEINRLLLAVSQGQLQTTRAARQELARRAGNNLFILKTIVLRIQERLKEEKRLWFNDRDVEAAFSDVRASFEQGGNWMLGHYLRDSLNEADSVNEWQPKRCYPLAVALASVGHSAQGQRRIELAVELVQKWCANLSAGEVVLKYTEERSKEDMEDLRELDVYKNSFRSELLEGYLRYVGKDHFPKEEDRQAIIRCGVECIREPQSLEFIAEGGQAKIYRFNKDSKMWAWRQIELHDPRANEAFLATQEALHNLRDLRHEEGGPYLYNLDQVGISENDYGVEVYRWIDGISLDKRVGTFSKEAVVDIGFRIGQAIKLIHAHGVLHRDISPRNIILTDKAFPVLVDFGLARAANRKMNTVIGGEDAPPEVQGDSPTWTKAADIYGFGVTIQKLLKAKEGGSDPLYDLLGRCLSRAPKQRPNAEELLNNLEDIRVRLCVQDIRDKAYREIVEVANGEGMNGQFQGVLLKFRAQFEGIAIGLYPRMIERCAEMAVFLDQTLEAFTPGGEKLTLGGVKYKGLRDKQITGQSVEFAHSLRIYKSHFNSPENLRKFDSLDDQLMYDLMTQAAEQIGQGLRLPQLSNVVKTTLSWPSTSQRDT